MAIEHLGVPYPTLVTPPIWLPVLGDIVRLLFLTLFCIAARERLDRLTTLKAAALVGVLQMCLSETLRVAVIDFCLANEWSGRHWLFAAVDLPARMVTGFSLGALALLISRLRVGRFRTVVIFAAVLAGGVFVRLVATPLIKEISATLLAFLGVSQPDDFYQPPYGPGMLAIIYLTFLEPTIAAFVMAMLSWNGLPGRRRARIIAFSVLILGASGRVTLLLVNSFWVRQPPVLAFLSTGQFFAENTVMAVSVALLYAWFRPVMGQAAMQQEAGHVVGETGSPIIL